LLDQKRKQPRPRRRLDQHLEPVRQQVGVAVAAAELAVIVDRMIVSRGGLKGEKLRLRHGARGGVKLLAVRGVLEIARGPETMAGGIKGLGHGGPCSYGLRRRLATSAACRWRPVSKSSSMYSRYVTPAASAHATRIRRIDSGGFFQASACAWRQQKLTKM